MAVVGESGMLLRFLLCFSLVHDFLLISCEDLTREEGNNLWESHYRGSNHKPAFQEVLYTHSEENNLDFKKESSFYEVSRQRRAVTSARELKSSVEDTIANVANQIENDYAIALYGSTCSSPVLVYNSCQVNIPDLKTDDRYSVPVSLTTSSVHFSSEAQQLSYGNKEGDPLYKILMNSLCVSDGVVPLWKNNMEQDGVTLKWQGFVDSSTGYSRIYPGVNGTAEQCQDDYDPRHQSWYVGMVSPPKDVAIVIDVTKETNMELMKEAAHAAINTLSKSDYGEIFFSSGLDSESISESTFKKAVTQQRQEWHTEIDGLQTTSENSSLGEVVTKAMVDLKSHMEERETEAPGSCVRVLLVLTDRRLNVDVLHDITNGNDDEVDVRVFMYTVGEFADDPVAKQISCDNKGAWFMLQNTSDIHQIGRYYQLLAPSEHLPQVLWSEVHQFRYENVAGVTGCLPATNSSNTILDNIGITCVFLEETTFLEFDNGTQVLTEMATSARTNCPVRLFTEYDLLDLRPENSQCNRPISRTAQELRSFAENAVEVAVQKAEINYQIALVSGQCFFMRDFHDTCRYPPGDLDYDKLFGREISMATATTHLTWDMEQMLSEDASLEDFKSMKGLYSALCMSESLDSHWQAFAGENLDIKWQFYGDQHDRFIRIYPGIEDTSEECSMKGSEAPFRTWFPSAASSPKDVIIIMDANHEEQLQLLQETAASMINTLTRYDFANIISNGQELYRGMVKTSKEQRDEMTDFARNLNISYGRDVLGSFQKATALWVAGKNSGNASLCVEAILFVTDSVLPDQYLTAIKEILKDLDGFRVFTYSVGPLADQTNSWQLACKTMGVWVNIDNPYDIWNKVSDYYNYFSSNEQTSIVIWSDVYEDRYGLGNVLSGCLPVYDTQSTHMALLGVLCIDILEQTLKSFPDWKEVYQSMMGGNRRCPAIQLDEPDIEDLREDDEKCDRHAITTAKQMYRYTEDALRRQADSAQTSYRSILEPGVTSCPFGDKLTEVCPTVPAEKTVRPDVAYPEKVLYLSTVVLTSEDSAEIGNDLKHLDTDSPLFSALCLSQTFTETWNTYSQVAYHYFIGSRALARCARVFPDVSFGKDSNFCEDGQRSDGILRIQKETDLNSRLNPKDVMIVVQNQEGSTLELMKQAIYTIADDLAPTDKVGMVTAGGYSHHDNQMEFFTWDSEQKFRDFIESMEFSKPVRDLERTVEEGFTVLKTNTQHCSPVMIILTDEAIYDDDFTDLVSELNTNFNATVLVYLFGKGAGIDETKRIAMETACANRGAWDTVTSLDIVHRVSNFSKYLPSDLASIQSPVWFEMTHDLLIPDIQSEFMVACMPVVADGILQGTLCDSIAQETFTLFDDGPEVLTQLKRSTHQCQRVNLTESQLSELRRGGAQCVPPKPRGMVPGTIVGMVLAIMIGISLLVVLAVIVYKHRMQITAKFPAALRHYSIDRGNNSQHVDGVSLLISEEEDRL